MSSSSFHVLDNDILNENRSNTFFKDPSYQRTKLTSDKKRAWRSLKQIITLERSMPWDKSSVHYSSIDAPQSLKPPKKYSDVSGLPAKYRDPATGLLYALVEEYSIVKTLPSDIISGYVGLRKSLNHV